MHIAKITANFIIGNFTTSTNNPTGDIWVVPFKLWEGKLQNVVEMLHDTITKYRVK